MTKKPIRPDDETIDAFDGETRAERRGALPVFRGWTFKAQFDEDRLSNNQARVLHLLLDERWHTLNELRHVGGSSGDRRARTLRAFGFSVDVVRSKDREAAEARHGESPPATQEVLDVHPSLWIYRLRPGTVTQAAMDAFFAGISAGRERLEKAEREAKPDPGRAEGWGGYFDVLNADERAPQGHTSMDPGLDDGTFNERGRRRGR